MAGVKMGRSLPLVENIHDPNSQIFSHAALQAENTTAPHQEGHAWSGNCLWLNCSIRRAAHADGTRLAKILGHFIRKLRDGLPPGPSILPSTVN